MRTACGLTLLVLVAGCSRESPAARQPETVLLHGKIFTGSATEFADALLVRGTRIAEVGPAEDVVVKAAPDARRIDLMGRLVIPGINDAHLHMDFILPEHTALQFDDMDPPCALALERVRDAARRSPSAKPIIGAIGATAFFDGACTAQALDRLAPEHAVILHTWTPHAAILNQAAVKMFAVPTSGPPEGGFYGKDGRSPKWDGVIQEYAFFQLWVGLSKLVSDEEASRQVKRVLDEGVRMGITTLQPMSADPERLVRLLQRMTRRCACE